MVKYPKISIVTPSFNQVEFLEKTILSVLSQGYPNIEYMIIDGGSNDGSVDVIRRYAERLAYWESTPDRGQSQAINKGFAKCTGEIMGWLNSDDTLENNALFNVAAAFANKYTKIVYGDCRIVDTRGNELGIIRPGPISVWRLLNFHIANSIPPQPSIYFRSECLRKVGGIKEDLHYGMDYDLWLRLADRYAFLYVPQILSNYRFHDKSKSVRDGGFNNFAPEWTKVANEFVKRKNIVFRWWRNVKLEIEKHQGESGRLWIWLKVIAGCCKTAAFRLVRQMFQTGTGSGRCIR